MSMGVQIPQKGFFDDVALEDDYQHELDLLIVTQMSRSIETPIVGLSDVFGMMPIENAIETNPSIPKVTLLLGA